MIFNKTISIILSGLFLLFLMLLFSLISIMFLGKELVHIAGFVMIFIFYYVAKAFYGYLRNDDQYKNNRQVSSDMPGEKYITKGESDIKKVFVVVWVLIILVLSVSSLWLYSFNHALI